MAKNDPRTMASGVGRIDPMSATRKTILVGLNGYLSGEHHPRAKLTDAQVEQIRQLAESGTTYGVIATRFMISKVMVGRICRFERRHSDVYMEVRCGNRK